MPYSELAFVVVCVVAVLQAIGRHVPVPMAALQIAAGAAWSAFAELDDLREQSAMFFVMLVPPLLYVEARHIPKRELPQAIKPVLSMAIGLVTLTILATGAAVSVIATGLRRLLQSDGTDSVRIDTTLSLLAPYAAYLASELLLCPKWAARHVRSIECRVGCAVLSTIALR